MFIDIVPYFPCCVVKIRNKFCIIYLATLATTPP